MRWLEVAITANGEVVETASAVLHRHCTGGVAVEMNVQPDDDRDGGFLDGESALATVRAYLPVDSAMPERRRAIEEAVWHLQQLLPDSAIALRFAEVREEDWATAWKQHYHALSVGPFQIVPAWEHEPPRAGMHLIRLDPGMAFGTGIHASTQLVLLAMGGLEVDGARVADVGTGSGILAIAAARRGARAVEAVDVETVAVEVARANVELNGLADRVRVRHGSVEALPPGPYDLVLANIVAAVIAELLPGLKSLVRPGGAILVAGIIADREHLVLDAAGAQRLRVARRAQRDDWVCLELRPS